MKIYLVHIRALVSLYQISADKCTQILFNHFIYTIRNPTCLSPEDELRRGVETCWSYAWY